MDTLQPVIKTENLNVVYNKKTSIEFWALQDINIKIYPKEYIIFFGPSGCGKSTLLNSIAGLETHIEGKVFVDDKDISTMNEDELAAFHRTRIGMVFQVYNLIPSLSVLDNVTLPQVFLGIHKGERTKRAKVYLERFGILAHADKIPTELSGGQQQRIGIARSLVNDPKILLADEPVGNLDSVSAVNVMELLNNLNKKEGKTLILVTHNPEHLVYANRIFYIKDGRIIREAINKDIRPETAIEEVERTEEVKKLGFEEKINKELELLQRSFPGLTSTQLNMLLIPFKAKLLANYLLSDYEVDEIIRIENIVHDRLSGRISKEELRFKLDAAYEKGGAGLNSITAIRLGGVVENLIVKTEIIIKGRGGKDGLLMKNSKQGQPDFKAIWSQITQLRHSFIDPMKGDLTDRQIIRMESAIYNRLIGDFDKKSFYEMLDRTFEQGGVGLNKATAKKITRDLEMVMLLSYRF
ncbi:ABC transporter ATP-binding protein [Patescibacteria group bacterium]|nr:ABC transporter ATP-binding protein [Patescibacteria group bacterium]MBU4141631.1 ABC transporter ATP-binding protein [Patescibacteria group bacterium]